MAVEEVENREILERGEILIKPFPSLLHVPLIVRTLNRDAKNQS